MLLADLMALIKGKASCPPQKLSLHDLCQSSLSRMECDDSLPLLWSSGR
jgi:hypothetical protein